MQIWGYFYTEKFLWCPRVVALPFDAGGGFQPLNAAPLWDLFIVFFNPYKSGVPFLGHRQTVQTLMRRGISSGSTLFVYRNFYKKLNKWKNAPDSPKIESGLVQMIMMEKSIRQMCVYGKLRTLQQDIYMSGNSEGKRDSYITSYRDIQNLDLCHNETYSGIILWTPKQTPTTLDLIFDALLLWQTDRQTLYFLKSRLHDIGEVTYYRYRRQVLQYT